MSATKKTSLLLLLLASTLLIFSVPSVEAAWLPALRYRKSYEIANATGAGTNYQVKITVINGSGTDESGTVYIDNKTRSDFGDLRFTDDDETTELDYWIEEVNSGENATFWVEVADDLSSSNATIYAYYGNSTMTTTSSGADTFPEFNGDGEGWTGWSGGQVDGDYYNVTDPDASVYWLEKDLDSPMSSMFAAHLSIRIDWTAGAQLLLYFGKEDANPYGCLLGRDTSDMVWDWYYWDGASGWSSIGVDIAENVWYKTERHFNFSDDTEYVYIDDDAGHGWYDWREYGVEVDQIGHFQAALGGSGTAGTIWIDHYFLRGLVLPEPLGTWGAEEDALLRYITFRFMEDGGQFRVDCVNTANGTQTAYVNGTVVELAAVVKNESWLFVNYTSTYGNSTENPYSYIVQGNDTITLYFRDPPLGKGVAPTVNYQILFVGACVLVGFMLIPWLVVRRRKRGG